MRDLAAFQLRLFPGLIAVLERCPVKGWIKDWRQDSRVVGFVRTSLEKRN
jgi:hypothetical protein